MKWNNIYKQSDGDTALRLFLVSGTRVFFLSWDCIFHHNDNICKIVSFTLTSSHIEVVAKIQKL